MKFALHSSQTSKKSPSSKEWTRLYSYIEKLQEVSKKHDYACEECSLQLPDDRALLQEVGKTVKKFKNSRLKYVIVVGIGGSNLGTKAIYDALQGTFDVLNHQRLPKLIFADTCDPTLITQISTLLKTQVAHPEEFVINVISKSGGTTETMVNAEALFESLEKTFPDLLKRCLMTTDEGSSLYKFALEHGIETLSIPHQVGGRYSVLSAVGLFPLGLIGIDIRTLRKGAAKIRQDCLSTDLMQNPAAQSALFLFEQHKKGKTIHDTFVFHPQLESIGKWYRQLLGESLGKEKDRSGKRVNAGITPTVSIGSTDLHSIGQLVLGGSRDKVTTFVWTAHHSSDTKLPKNGFFTNLVQGIGGKRLGEILSAIRQGTIAAYTKQRLPFMTVELKKNDTFSLGEFLQFKMIEVMLLGHLFQVNAFDQPQVELYKSETRKLLNG